MQPKVIRGTELTGDGEPIFQRQCWYGVRSRIPDPNRRSAAAYRRNISGWYGGDLVVMAILLLTRIDQDHNAHLFGFRRDC